MTIYTLYLHDFGNLCTQVITSSEFKDELDKMADKMNFIFINAGYSGLFEAQICEEKVEL